MSYTNIYSWAESNLGKTLDNRHRQVWEDAGTLLVSIPINNIEVWNVDDCIITIRTYATKSFKLLDIQ